MVHVKKKTHHHYSYCSLYFDRQPIYFNPMSKDFDHQICQNYSYQWLNSLNLPKVNQELVLRCHQLTHFILFLNYKDDYFNFELLQFFEFQRLDAHFQLELFLECMMSLILNFSNPSSLIIDLFLEAITVKQDRFEPQTMKHQANLKAHLKWPFFNSPLLLTIFLLQYLYGRKALKCTDCLIEEIRWMEGY